MKALHLLAQYDVPKIEEKEESFSSNLDSLIDAGADINATNNEGETPLHCALFYGGNNTFALFLARKPNLSYRTK